jgi:hypothetical protein
VQAANDEVLVVESSHANGNVHTILNQIDHSIAEAQAYMDLRMKVHECAQDARKGAVFEPMRCGDVEAS